MHASCVSHNIHPHNDILLVGLVPMSRCFMINVGMDLGLDADPFSAHTPPWCPGAGAAGKRVSDWSSSDLLAFEGQLQTWLTADKVVEFRGWLLKLILEKQQQQQSQRGGEGGSRRSSRRKN